MCFWGLISFLSGVDGGVLLLRGKWLSDFRKNDVGDYRVFADLFV